MTEDTSLIAEPRQKKKSSIGFKATLFCANLRFVNHVKILLYLFRKK